MAKVTLQTSRIPAAPSHKNQAYDLCNTDANDMEGQRSPPTTSPSQQMQNHNDQPQGTPEEPSDINLAIYSIKEGDIIADLEKSDLNYAQMYCAEADISCRYLKDRPAIRHFLFHIIATRSLKERQADEDRAAMIVEKLNGLEILNTLASDVVQALFKCQDLMLCIKIQGTDHSVPIKNCTSQGISKKLDERFGKATYSILRAIALHQHLNCATSNTANGTKLEMAINEIDRAFTFTAIKKAQWILHPDNLFKFAAQFPRLSPSDKCAFHAIWHIWKGQPVEALKTLNDNRDILKGKIHIIEVRANYEAGDLEKGHELRHKLKSPERTLLPFYLFELTMQGSNRKEEALESLKRMFYDPKTFNTVFTSYVSNAINGCALYHLATAAKEPESTRLMTRSIRSWEDALQATHREKTNTSMDRFIANITLCALKFKCPSENAHETFEELNTNDQVRVIYYYSYINKEWLDIMYAILKEYGKHEYVEKRPQRIEC